ncbi:MAG: F0F1 ATP synthase subunit B [Bacteroidota bacterium]|jgi:F-type H+-transporting ATPase subunit b
MTILLAGGGLLSVDIGLAFWILITFLVFLLILKKFAWGPMLDALDQRENSIKDSLEAAEKAMEKAERISNENKKALREAEHKAQQIRKEAINEAEMIRQERIAKSKEEADQMIEKAKQTIEQEKKNALQELRKEVAHLAIKSASMIIDAELDNERNSKLVDDFIQDISKN